MADRWYEREKRLDYRAGCVAAIIANVNRDPKERPEPYAPADWFPSLREPKPEAGRQEPEEIEAQLRMITAALGGTINDETL